jgi:outer membrane receptor protein involved in Fe transport
MNAVYRSIATAGVALLIRTVAAGAAQTDAGSLPVDTLRTYRIDEVVITSSTKETNHLRTLPGAVSILSPHTIRTGQIESLKDVSALVPNLYIPDYGARLTSAIYLRGVGARSSGQSVGLYVDGVPVPDKSTFDFELTDIQHIEIHRGPQGTLYGRNAMAGIINIHTLSPFRYQGTRLSASAGSYGLFKAGASHYFKRGETLGVSLGGYYSRTDGYFTNRLTGRKADPEETAGGRLKLEWRPFGGASAAYTFSYDYVGQGAFPYGLYRRETGAIDPVRIGSPSSYSRHIRAHSLLLEYRTAGAVLSSATGYQYFSDDMRMDQDFSPLTLFTLSQQQRQKAFSQECAVRSHSSSPWQWSFGLYAFLHDLHTEAPVTFGPDGMKQILQPVFDRLKEDNPRMPALQVMDEELHIPGSFDTPSRGVAFFHQSTYNGLFTAGLSLTAGLRIDVERQQMDYRSSARMRMGVGRPGQAVEIPGIPVSRIDAGVSQQFRQWLPKLSLRYAFTPRTFAYLSAAGGYKTGGYNVQMSADVMQSLMRYDMMSRFVPSLAVAPEPVERVMAYRPEHSLNYEAGLRSEHPAGLLSAELTLFYTDIRDMQITRFVDSGAGRILSNAGRARSLGAEASLHVRPSEGLTAHLNYGYTRAVFLNGDHRGNLLPYIPAHTLNTGLQYTRPLRLAWADRLEASARLSGLGPICWTEQNDIRQSFYTLLHLKAGLRKGPLRADLWVRNLTNTQYAAFYFESFGQPYAQKGHPLQAGIELSVSF